ncbi:unnamed protein product [Urochloa humidicola]
MNTVQIAPQPAILEGVSAPVMHHIPHAMTSPSKNSGIFSSSANEGDDWRLGNQFYCFGETRHLATGLDLKLPYA